MHNCTNKSNIAKSTEGELRELKFDSICWILYDIYTYNYITHVNVSMYSYKYQKQTYPYVIQPSYPSSGFEPNYRVIFIIFSSI